MSELSMKRFIEERGWYTFRSPNNWMNDKIMDDMSLDSSGLNLIQAYEFQKMLESK